MCGGAPLAVDRKVVPGAWHRDIDRLFSYASTKPPSVGSLREVQPVRGLPASLF